MTQRRTLVLAAVTMVMALGNADSAAQRSTAPIRRIDHIMIRADDPAKVYAFFTDVLQLPVAWPMMSPREGVATGGVGFGNVNVEAIRFPGQKSQARGGATPWLCIRALPIGGMSCRLGSAGYQVRRTASLDLHRVGRLEEYAVDKRHVATVFER
jgi:hypothetical protein